MQISMLDRDTAEDLQQRAAGWYTRQRIDRGDRIAVVAATTPAYLAAVGAALRMGIVPVPLPAGGDAAGVHELVSDADVRVLLDGNDLEAVVSAEPLADVDLSPVPLTRPMLYTSGTTGRRKGVYVAPWSEELACLAFLDEVEQWHFSADDVHLVCSPLYHSAPLRFALHTLAAGGRVVLPSSFDPSACIDLLATASVTTTFMAPTQVQRLVFTGALLPGSLRLLAHAGAPCRPDVKRALHEAIGAERAWEFYGSTEAQFTAIRGDEWAEREGSVGRARAERQLRIAPDGVVWCRQPLFARFEYWRDADKTATAWNGNECTAGDVGRLDADGYLYLDGRREDLIVSGGVNVYPAEVERVLGALPDIGDVAVIGVDDETWGQAVWLVYTGPAEATTIAGTAREMLPPASRPKHYRRLDTLPMTTTGKLARAVLRASLK